MSAKMSFYDVLGVHNNASLDEIKKAYRERAKKFHPDLNKKQGTEELFGVIQEAYETLSNSDLRLEYDKQIVYENFKAEQEKQQQYQQQQQYNQQYHQQNYHQQYHEPEVRHTKEYIVIKDNKFSFDGFDRIQVVRGIVWFILVVIAPALTYVETRSVDEIVFYYVGLGLFALFTPLLIGLLGLCTVLALVIGFFTREMYLIMVAGTFAVITAILYFVFLYDE